MYKFVFCFIVYLLNPNSPNIILKLFPTLIYSLCIFDNFVKTTKKHKKLKYDFTFLCFLVVVVIAVLRNNHPEQTMSYNYFRILNFFLILILFGRTFSAYFAERGKNILSFFIKTILVPLSLLLLINILGLLFNIGGTGEEASGSSEALLLSKLGVYMNRVDFPFSPGYNAYGSLAGVMFVLGLYGYMFIKKHNFLWIYSLLLSIVTITLIDTRTAFIVPILLLPLMYLMRKSTKSRFVKLLPLVTVFGNTIIITLLTIISKISSLSFLERSSGDLESGNSRIIIWGFSIIEFARFKWSHVLGHGEYGWYASRVSLKWAPLFEKWDNPELTSPHSTLFLILYDYGYVGLLLIVLLQYKIIKAIKVCWSSDNHISIILSLFLLYWNALGMTESFFGLYTTKILILFCLISYFSIQIVDVKKHSMTKTHN